MLLILATFQLKAQGQVENSKIFTITINSDSIQFLRISKDTISPKPVILFCQGSLPLPLILIDKEVSVIPVFNFFQWVISSLFTGTIVKMDSISMARRHHFGEIY